MKRSNLVAVKMETLSPESPPPPTDAADSPPMRAAYRECCLRRNLLLEPMSLGVWRAAVLEVASLPHPQGEAEEVAQDELVLDALQGRHRFHMERLRKRQRLLQEALQDAVESRGHLLRLREEAQCALEEKRRTEVALEMQREENAKLQEEEEEEQPQPSPPSPTPEWAAGWDAWPTTPGRRTQEANWRWRGGLGRGRGKGRPILGRR